MQEAVKKTEVQNRLRRRLAEKVGEQVDAWSR